MARTGKSISAWVDEGLAGSVERAAAEHDHTPAQFLAAAAQFYVSLPDQARTVWRRILMDGTEFEKNGALREVTRALIRSHMAITINRANDERDTTIVGDSELLDEELAVADERGERDRG